MFFSSVRVEPSLLLLKLLIATATLVLSQCAHIVYLTLLILLLIIVDVIDSPVEFGVASFDLEVVSVGSRHHNWG